MSDTKLGTFDDLLAITVKDLRPIVVRLQELILDLHPTACVVVRMGDRAATFGVGPKKMSEGYAYIMPHKQWVNLGFYKGALLSTGSDLLEGSGKLLRHIKIRSLDKANQPEVKQLLQLAIAERQAALRKTDD